jgi:GNAT superfamily N-acetyltransferase
VIAIAEELLSGLWVEMRPLLEAHWEEISRYKDIELEPDVEAYAMAEAGGLLRTYTARAAGRLAGYVIFFLRPNMHYRRSLQAAQDVLYLHPDYRRGMAGVTLIRVAETRLRAEGVQVIYHHVKRTNRVGELLERLGYEHVENVYAKRLDKKE